MSINLRIYYHICKLKAGEEKETKAHFRWAVCASANGGVQVKLKKMRREIKVGAGITNFSNVCLECGFC